MIYRQSDKNSIKDDPFGFGEKHTDALQGDRTIQFKEKHPDMNTQTGQQLDTRNPLENPMDPLFVVCDFEHNLKCIDKRDDNQILN